jgi:hypothetical protein
MIKHILAVGDSFTYGEELSDRNTAWPHLVANEFKCEITNAGAPGAGNKSIVRKTIENLSSMEPSDLVIIGWTSPGRIEFADEDGIFDTWPGYAGKWTHHPWRKELTKYINRYHCDEYIYEQYLIDIILLQSYLKVNNIRYLMTPVAGNEYYKNKFKFSYSELRKQIDITHFIDPGNGMAEWTYGCKQGPNGHFLDAGHRIVADKVISKIKEFKWDAQ